VKTKSAKQKAMKNGTMITRRSSDLTGGDNHLRAMRMACQERQPGEGGERMRLGMRDRHRWMSFIKPIFSLVFQLGFRRVTIELATKLRFPPTWEY
jgi:hypothetical protein